MASRKKVEEPVYPEAPLIISREKFCKLLSEQIERGIKLLEINVPVINQMSGYYGMGYSPRENTIHYDEKSKNDFLAKYGQWNDRNKTIYRTSFSVSESIYFHEYESHIWNRWGTSDEMKAYKDEISRLINQMQSDISRVDLIKCSVIDESALQEKSTDKARKLSDNIFIVHGHNEEMKQTVARVVTMLGLKPVILHEQPNGGRTIIEKFEANAEQIDLAIILLSADDLAESVKDLEGVKDQEVRSRLKKRARQNVVFEMGYFSGKLKRSNVFLLLQAEVEKPGDLDGLVYTSYDSANGAWRFELVRELHNAGYSVDANKLLM